MGRPKISHILSQLPLAAHLSNPQRAVSLLNSPGTPAIPRLLLLCHSSVNPFHSQTSALTLFTVVVFSEAQKVGEVVSGDTFIHRQKKRTQKSLSGTQKSSHRPYKINDQSVSDANSQRNCSYPFVLAQFTEDSSFCLMSSGCPEELGDSSDFL